MHQMEQRSVPSVPNVHIKVISILEDLHIWA